MEVGKPKYVNRNVWRREVSALRDWSLRAFHLVRTHLGGVGGVKLPIHFRCVLHAKRRWVGPDSM